ncbi:DUF4296 domain-containing protein [Polaribacter sp.]|uniref:DUF4296 domain-containing protein n=1 Tax=Polaribacter sp. TaxID=1920175 RepID=UPI003F6A747C
MKAILIIFCAVLLFSCTSNTILEKPKDLIPKDTMQLLLQEMVIASSAKFIKNKNLQKSVNYMPIVYEKFKIDSARFQTSNFYYMSKIDDYQKILERAKESIEEQGDFYKQKQTRLDSIKKDSIDKAKKLEIKLDSLKIVNDSLKKHGIKLDTLNTNILNDREALQRQ